MYVIGVLLIRLTARSRELSTYGASERPTAHEYPDHIMIINEGPLRTSRQDVSRRSNMDVYDGWMW